MEDAHLENEQTSSVTRRRRGIGLGRNGKVALTLLGVIVLACFATLPYTTGDAKDESSSAVADSAATAVIGKRFEQSDLDFALFPPSWAPHQRDERQQVEAAGDTFVWLGTDRLGRDFLMRCLVGGSLSLLIGICAAMIAVMLGTFWGMTAGYFGGRIDAVMMRIVDVLFGLPYILLVVLLAVAMDGWMQSLEAANTVGSARVGGVSRFILEHRSAVNVITLMIAIGGVSWLTMARVIRGQVLSLKSQPFMEASRAIGVPVRWQFLRHLLPNILGPVIVYATLTVPQAILQESFLSFLGIGVKPPLPSWGNLAAEGLSELNPVRVRWWLLLFPCLFLATTLLCLNFLGESLRASFDPKRIKRHLTV